MSYDLLNTRLGVTPIQMDISKTALDFANHLAQVLQSIEGEAVCPNVETIVGAVDNHDFSYFNRSLDTISSFVNTIVSGLSETGVISLA